MLLLASTSDILRVVTGTAVAQIGVHASWVDNNAGAITPGRTNTAITTATTTTIVGSPAASTYRAVKFVAIQNNDPVKNSLITVQHYNGTTSSDIITVRLLPNETLYYVNESWKHVDLNGCEYAAPGVTDYFWQGGVPGTISESFPRFLGEEASATTPTSGTLYVTAILLRAGQILNDITFCAGNGSASAPTHCWMALYDSSLALKAQTADMTSEAWGSTVVKTRAFTATYTVPTTGLYYAAWCMVATTPNNLKMRTAPSANQLHNQTPILCATSTSGITTALPDPAGALTVLSQPLWAAVS
jgi:hypothetical protein